MMITNKSKYTFGNKTYIINQTFIASKNSSKMYNKKATKWGLNKRSVFDIMKDNNQMQNLQKTEEYYAEY